MRVKCALLTQLLHLFGINKPNKQICIYIDKKS